MFIIHNHFSNLGTFVYFVSLLSVCNFSFICHYVFFFEKKGSVLRVLTVSQLQC